MQITREIWREKMAGEQMQRIRQRISELLETPEGREIYRKALAKWDKRLAPLIEANRNAGRITGDDLNIRVGPCAEIFKHKE